MIAKQLVYFVKTYFYCSVSCEETVAFRPITQFNGHWNQRRYLQRHLNRKINLNINFKWNFDEPRQNVF
jgi:hypothetical protein